MWDVRVLREILGDVDVVPLGTCDGTVLGYLEGLIDGAMVGNFEVLLLGP